MDYLYHFEFCAWNKKMVSQEAEIKAIPMGCFTRLGKIFGGDVPLHHQFSITTQRSFKFPVVNEMHKCF
jgi:hypothetical protein